MLPISRAIPSAATARNSRSWHGTVFTAEDQTRELERRSALMDADPNALSPWADVEARVLAGLKKKSVSVALSPEAEADLEEAASQWNSAV